MEYYEKSRKKENKLLLVCLDVSLLLLALGLLFEEKIKLPILILGSSNIVFMWIIIFKQIYRESNIENDLISSAEKNMTHRHLNRMIINRWLAALIAFPAHILLSLFFIINFELDGGLIFAFLFLYICEQTYLLNAHFRVANKNETIRRLLISILIALTMFIYWFMYGLYINIDSYWCVALFGQVAIPLIYFYGGRKYRKILPSESSFLIEKNYFW